MANVLINDRWTIESQDHNSGSRYHSWDINLVEYWINEFDRNHAVIRSIGAFKTIEAALGFVKNEDPDLASLKLEDLRTTL